MSLLVLLPLGGSLLNLKKQGQEGRFINHYLKLYRENFSEVYLASFINEPSDSNLFVLLPNTTRLHRYLYAFFFPFMHWKILSNVQVVRVMQLSSLPTALIIKLFFGCKVAVTYGYQYDKFALIEGKKIQAILFLLFKKILLPFADVVFYPVKQEYLSNKSASGARYLPNGVNLSDFNLNRRFTGGNKINFLSVGRLERQKDYLLMVKSIANSDFNGRAVVTIVGDGTIKSELIELAKRHNVELHLPGALNNEALPKIYSHSDIFILSSIAEGVSKSLLEAAASGCALLVRKMSQNTDLFDDNKECLTFSTADELTDKINLLCEREDLRKKLGKAASLRARRDYDLKKILQHEVHILKTI